MFRTVLHCSPNAPKHLILCDDPMCGAVAECTLDASCFVRDNRQLTADYIEDSQKGFFEALGRDGWVIGMNQILCPIHAVAHNRIQGAKNEAIQVAYKEHAEKMAEKQSRIVQPTGKFSNLSNIAQIKH